MATSPSVGFSPKIAQQLAECDRSPRRCRPPAVPAPLPPLLPRRRSILPAYPRLQGLRLGPKIRLSVIALCPNSGVLVFPRNDSSGTLEAFDDGRVLVGDKLRELRSVGGAHPLRGYQILDRYRDAVPPPGPRRMTAASASFAAARAAVTVQ